MPSTMVEGLESRLLFSVTPGPTTTIEAINIDQNTILNGAGEVPPDPIAAAGPTQVVNVVNSSIEWYTKAGVQQQSESTYDFFSPAFSNFQLNPPDIMTDPKVVYDQYANRFVVSMDALSFFDINGVADESNVVLAVSNDSNPNDGWSFQAINTGLTINGQTTFTDFPQLAIDQKAIYVTGNMFDFATQNIFEGSRLWIVDKTGLYGGGTSTVNVYDPSTLAGAPDQLQTLEPAHMYGTNVPSGLGTFLVSTTDSNDVELNDISTGVDYADVISIQNPLTSPTFTNSLISLGNIESASFPATAPQMGDPNGIDTNDTRVLDAVWRNNALWAVNTINPISGPDAGQATAHWYRFDTTNPLSVTVADQGNVGGEDLAPQTSTYMPSIAVDAAGDMAVGFAASGPNLLAGAYYAGRRASDPPGTVEGSATLAAGLDTYYQTLGNDGPGDNRWGDYSAIAIDPSDDSTFWVYNQYASTRDPNPIIPTDDGRWATRYGSFSFGSAPAPRVTGVEVAGTAWSSSFTSYLTSQSLGNANGYAVPGGVAELTDLPWTNVNQISINFSTNVLVKSTALMIDGVNVATYGIQSFAYNSATDTATWTLTAPVPDDKLLLKLDGTSATGVKDLSGNLLDGEWTSGVSTFPSGNGIAGGDFNFQINVLPGDTNQNGGVNVSDTIQTRNRQGSSTTNATNYSVFNDVNGDGGINVSDTILVRNRQGTTLPAGAPTAALVFNSAKLSTASAPGFSSIGAAIANLSASALRDPMNAFSTQLVGLSDQVNDNLVDLVDGSHV